MHDVERSPSPRVASVIDGHVRMTAPVLASSCSTDLNRLGCALGVSSFSSKVAGAFRRARVMESRAGGGGGSGRSRNDCVVDERLKVAERETVPALAGVR